MKFPGTIFQGYVCGWDLKHLLRLIYASTKPLREISSPFRSLTDRWNCFPWWWASCFAATQRLGMDFFKQTTHKTLNKRCQFGMEKGRILYAICYGSAWCVFCGRNNVLLRWILQMSFWVVKLSGQIITTSAEVTLNGGLIRELPQNPLNSGLGIILICPELCSKCSKV